MLTKTELLQECDELDEIDKKITAREAVAVEGDVVIGQEIDKLLQNMDEQENSDVELDDLTNEELEQLW